MSEENREQKNSVFGQRPEGVDSHIQVISAVDKIKADLGVDLPVETIPLPSLGKCYGQGHPLCGKETIDIRAMTSREEDILMNRSYMKKGTIVTELLKSCLMDRSIDPSTLLSGDRQAILAAIRITGYGAEYKVMTTCKACESKDEFEFNLASLPIKMLDIDPAQPNTNYFEFTLPYTKKIIGFKFMTGQDEDDLSAAAEKQKKMSLGQESTVSSALFKTVLSIDGSTDRTKISQFVKLMPARDSLALRTYIKNHEPSIIFKQEMTCPKCENVEEVDVPMGVSFLWPGIK